jgi:chloramphenicol-sensitive protein RarD
MMNKGVIYAISAYVLWGFLPLYFKLLHNVPPLQILAHRFFWSFLLLIVFLNILGQFQKFKSAITKKILLNYSIAGVVLAVNWGTFIYAVNSDHILESSLGYFINPIVSVFLGVVFLKEKLRLFQWIPVLLAASGVLYLTIMFGSIPWIALVLAFTFGFYGLTKKISPLDSLPGLTLETGILLIPAILYLLFQESQGVGSFGHSGLDLAILLALSGVITAIPLLLFSAGIRRINLTTIGILQYTTPTIHFFMGIFMFGEYFDIHRLTGFVLIWIGLIIYSLETIHDYKTDRQKYQIWKLLSLNEFIKSLKCNH